MRITSIHAQDTYGDQICFVTEPEIDDAIIEELRKHIFDDSSVKVSEYFGKLVVTGIHPFALEGSFFAMLHDFLQKADDAVYREKKRKHDAHENLLKHISEVSGLPIS